MQDQKPSTQVRQWGSMAPQALACTVNHPVSLPWEAGPARKYLGTPYCCGCLDTERWPWLWAQVCPLELSLLSPLHAWFLWP